MSAKSVRFWAKVDIRGPDECWPWLAGRSAGGRYGSFRDGEMVDAHRVAWELANGKPVPDGLLIRHDCDYSLCCNPNHLQPGTQQQNVEDMYARGRSVNHRGSQHVNSRINEKIVIEIRRAMQAGEKRKSIAKRYGISIGCVRYANVGWKHVRDHSASP